MPCRLIILSFALLLLVTGATVSPAADDSRGRHTELTNTRALVAQGLDRDAETFAEPKASFAMGLQTFEEVVNLIRENYVHELSDEEIFLAPIDSLTFTMLPHCTEDVQFSEACNRDPRRCLRDFLKGITNRCHVNREQLLTKVLNALLSNLDANSNLLDADMMKELTIGTSGKFGGVGMVVTLRGGDYVVVSPFEGSPALKAGIKSGDTVVEIDGQVLHGLSLMDVLRKVRGPAGSVMSVSLQDGRTGQLKELRVRRQVITVPPVRYVQLASGIAYLRIVNFQHNTAAEVRKVLSRLPERGAGELRGLILDLRDNPGGLFNEAIQVADQFLPSGPITSVRGRNRLLNEEFMASTKAGFRRTPLVILINRGTASASEILTGALQGRPQVVVMGEKSFGKASVQAVYPLRKGTALRLTTAHYYTADGRDIDGKGLEPDLPADVTSDGLTEKVDLLNRFELEGDRGVKEAVNWLCFSNSPNRSPWQGLF